MINNLKKYLFLVVTIIAIAVLGLLLFLTRAGNRKNIPTPQPTITEIQKISPTQSVQTFPTSPQEQSDKVFSNEMKKIQTIYPWYNKLPIINPNYFVYFDVEKKQLIAKIYSKSNNLSADQVSNIKNEITTKLLGLEIPVDQFPIAWQTGF